MISETSNQKFRSVLSLSVFGLFFNLDYQPPKRKWHSSWSCHATFERLSEGLRVPPASLAQLEWQGGSTTNPALATTL
jgi:hypothetical protein